MPIPKHGKRDNSEGPIKEALIAAGATVLPLNIPNCPDFLVGFRGINYLIENKSGKSKLRIGQAHWAENWAGGEVIVAHTPEEALRGIGAA